MKKCSFCGKWETKDIITGTVGYICLKCVDYAFGVFHPDNRKEFEGWTKGEDDLT